MRPTPTVTPLALRGRIARPQPKGLPVINLGFNELPYGPLPAVAKALAGAAARVQSYGPPRNDAVRAAIRARFGVDAERIVCGNGSEELLDVIARAFVRPGDHIVISQFGYIQFALTAHRIGAALIKAPEPAMVTDIDALLAAVTPATRLVFLANPNNPTGTMVPAEALARLAHALPEEVVLVLDLAYGEFAEAGYLTAVHDLVGQHENVVVTRTFSKAYGLAGARVGWVHAPDWMVPVLYGVRGMGTVNALAQAAAVAALSETAEVDRRIAETLSERDRVARGFAGMGVETLPSQANFLMARITGGDAARCEALVEHLFDASGLIVNRTREAGLEDFFRVSMGLPAQNDLLLESVAQFLG